MRLLHVLMEFRQVLEGTSTCLLVVLEVGVGGEGGGGGGGEGGGGGDGGGGGGGGKSEFCGCIDRKWC